jgi:hypothetical protein
VSAPRQLIIPANAAERRELVTEEKAQFFFFALFGGGCGIAALITAWPFHGLSEYRFIAVSVLCCFFAAFAALYIYQSLRLKKNIAAAKTLMYVGHITRKERDDDHEPIDFRIWIEDRPFEVGEEVFEEVKIGDLLAVREWLGSGDYIEHTLDARRIAELEKRATEAK